MRLFNKSKKGIKICRTDLGKLVSCFNDGQVVEYRIDKWTKRPKGCGPLAVFDSIESATDFILLAKNKILFHCKYKKSKENVLYMSYNYNRPTKTCDYAPDGTLFANKVKILEEVGL